MKIFSKFGEICIFIFVIPILFLGLIFMSPILLFILIQYLIAVLFKRLRNDPRFTIDKVDIREDSEYPSSPEEMVENFNSIIEVLNKHVGLNHISKVKIETEIDTNKEEIQSPEYENYVKLSATISSGVASAKLEMKAVNNPTESNLYSSYYDPEFEPFVEVTYIGNNKVETHFRIIGNEMMNFLIYSLKNGQTLSSARQIWVNINDNTNIVNYKILKSNPNEIDSDMGYRSVYSNLKARKYFFDK
jgi:hypothetical protein